MRQSWTVRVLRRFFSHTIHRHFLAFHDDLDFVSVQEKLAREFRAASITARGKQSLDTQIEHIARVKAKMLAEAPPAAKTALLQVSDVP